MTCSDFAKVLLPWEAGSTIGLQMGAAAIGEHSMVNELFEAAELGERQGTARHDDIVGGTRLLKWRRREVEEEKERVETA